MKNIKFIPVRMSHLKNLHKIVNDPEVSRFISITPPLPFKLKAELFASSMKIKNPWWVIKYEGNIAGSMSLMRACRSHGLKKMGHVASIGITIAQKYWGLGIGTVAIRFMLSEGRKLGFKRIELEVVSTNRRAYALYKKLGFKKEGVHKRRFKIEGRYEDSIAMAKWIG